MLKVVNTILGVTGICIQMCILVPWHKQISKDLQNLKNEQVVFNQIMTRRRTYLTDTVNKCKKTIESQNKW